MLTIHQVDTTDREQVSRFIDLPFRLYRDNPYWVPPFRRDIAMAMNREKHPFYEHSAAEFFLAQRDGGAGSKPRDVGRIAVIENCNYNAHHGTRQAQFYFFDCEEDEEAATALFERGFEWARARGLQTIVGPKGLTVFDGYGLLQRGFDERQMMTMMNYNAPYYLDLVQAVGFEKEVDFISHHVTAQQFQLPERVHRIAERVKRRNNLQVLQFESKRQLRQWGERIGRAYNEAFVENWEYVPLTDREIQFIVDEIMLVAVPQLIKVIAHEEEIVGFAFGWPDVSRALQRCNGRLTPWCLAGLLWEMRRTNWLAANGMGILPTFQGRGGNALLYTEWEKSLRGTRFEHVELTQVAETAVQMRHDLETLGGKPYKNHRVFRRAL